MYIFGYKTSIYPKFVHFSEIFWQKLHFYSKKYNFFVFSEPNVHFWVQNYSFYLKFVHFSEIFGKNFILSVKSTNFLVFQDQMLVKFFGKNFIFSVKSTIFFVFSEPNVHFWVHDYTFYLKFVPFSEIF